MGSHKRDGDRAPRTPRPLSQREREVLDHLLSVETPGVEELRQQAATALAVPWDCGCASIDLIVDRSATLKSTIRARPAIESYSRERHDEHGILDLLVWVDDDGWLSAVEIVDYGEKHGLLHEIPHPRHFDAPQAGRAQ